MMVKKKPSRSRTATPSSARMKGSRYLTPRALVIYPTCVSRADGQSGSRAVRWDEYCASCQASCREEPTARLPDCPSARLRRSRAHVLAEVEWGAVQDFGR